MLKRALQSIMILAMVAPWATASVLRIGAGELRLGGHTLVANRVEIESDGRLSGSGEIRASARIGGTLAPGSGAGDADELRFVGAVTFVGGVFECEALAHEELDRLVVSGDVTGFGTVELSKTSEAVPLGQIIIAGGPGSNYDALLASPGTEWHLGRTNNLDLTLTDLVGDSDRDGLPDWWEVEHFSHRTAASPQGDEDGDQFINWHEFRAGTHPRNAASRLVAWPIRRSATSDIVRWQSVPGKRYAIEMRTNLVSGFSQRLQSGIVATDVETAWTNPTVTAAARYYRIIVE